ncbi:MAG: DUF3168 domain-containing protein [Phenylobacterium sp.]|nr:DUF3168 domain-containing protein [Phenylobacterium sp.]
MQQDLKDALLDRAELTALVGDRIDWNKRLQGEGLPAIRLLRVSGGATYTLEGRRSFTDTVVQFDVYAETATELAAVVAQVRQALDVLRGAHFRGAVIENERDGTLTGDGPDGDGPSDLHRTSLDVRVWHYA